MKAELLKLRYLPTPRWIGALIAAVVLIVGTVLFILEPDDPAKYVDVPNASVVLVTLVASMVFAVWVSTLEFSAGTLQRTLTAEPDRGRVIATKLGVTLIAVAVAGLLAAAASGGLSHLAAAHAGVDIDEGELAAELFGAVPQWVSGAAIGFGFGLIARSPGGGIALSLIFVLAFDGFVSFIPGASDYTYGQLSQDLTNGLGDAGATTNTLAVAILGTVAWCALIVLPGWVRFLRGDLK